MVFKLYNLHFALCFVATITGDIDSKYAKWTSAEETTLVFYFSKKSLSAVLSLNITQH